ncbi:hypothetical protein, partial [Empedobacter brevis]|uniref:hypothetical protein n=1 Tax=Empedobacter brevis TaxID=247 RepID=UPI00289B6F27
MNNIIIIDDQQFKIIDVIEKISVADSFVAPSNKVGGGNGEAKLYVGQNTVEITDFFGQRGFEVDAILSKYNLKSYLDNAFREYSAPSMEYRRKTDLPELWEK